MVYSTNDCKPKLMIDVDGLSDGLSMVAFSSELHSKHRDVDPPHNLLIKS